MRDGYDPRKRTWNQPLPWKGGLWTLRDIVEYDKIAAFAFLEHAARDREGWLRSFAGLMRRLTAVVFVGLALRLAVSERS